MKILATSYGVARSEGQPSSDAFDVWMERATAVAVLSDGAGSGLPAREAAQRAVRSIVAGYAARPRAWNPAHTIDVFARNLNRAYFHESQQRYERSEMVATLSAVVIESGRLYGLNLGDSPVYLWRDGRLSTLSAAHVESTQKCMLTRALGMAPDIEPQCFEMPLRAGDIALLCSDGVANQLSAEDIASALSRHSTARTLVLDARQRADDESLDDMSAIVLDIRELPESAAQDVRTLDIPQKLAKADLFDGYELVRSFNTNNRVWLAQKNGQRVVLKFAPLEAVDSEPHLEAFIQETWNATRLRSQHFVRAFEPPGQTSRYYVMEFVDAPVLSSVLNKRLLSVDSAIGLGKFLADAAQTLLRHELVHGDIKPENILCVGEYTHLTFKLLDLGSAAPVFSVTSRAGTASYLAPERFHGAPISERTEIFSIGVTLYEALTGKLPFGVVERYQTPAFHAPKKLASLNPNLPPWLEALIHRCLAIDPAHRYQHYSELAFDLEHPDLVEPYHDAAAPWIERDPLTFYKRGFYLLLIVSAALFILLLTQS